jgi:hypothetical protein
LTTRREFPTASPSMTVERAPAPAIAVSVVMASAVADRHSARAAPGVVVGLVDRELRGRRVRAQQCADGGAQRSPLLEM